MIFGCNKKPEGYAAHRIVPRDLKKLPEANDARKLLEEIGLDTNEAFNGVHPPQTKAAAGTTGARMDRLAGAVANIFSH